MGISNISSFISSVWHVPNVRLPFFGNTQQGDVVNLHQGSPSITFQTPNVVLPRPSAPSAPATPPPPPMMAQVQSVNQQTQATINRITTHHKILGPAQIHCITKQLDKAQKQLTAMEATADPQSKAYIDNTLKDLNKARQMYAGMDDSAAMQKTEDNIKAQASKDSQADKTAADNSAKAFGDADDKWELNFQTNGQPPQ